jgi:hypothetical protein
VVKKRYHIVVFGLVAPVGLPLAVITAVELPVAVIVAQPPFNAEFIDFVIVS